MNDQNKLRITRVVGVALVLLALPAALQAATARMTSNVMRTLAAEDASYGGCMAQLQDSVMEATGLDCSGNWEPSVAPVSTPARLRRGACTTPRSWPS